MTTFEQVCGVGHSLQYLRELYPVILYYPRTEQAKLADAVVRHFHANPVFNRQQLMSRTSGGAQAIGNLAFMSAAAL